MKETDGPIFESLTKRFEDIKRLFSDHGDEISQLKPLEQHVVSQAIGIYLLDGYISTLKLVAQSLKDPRRVMYTRDGYEWDEMQEAIRSLVDKGITSYDEEHNEFSLPFSDSNRTPIKAPIP